MENFYRPEEAFLIILNIFKFLGVWPAAVKNPNLKFIYIIYGYGFQLFYVVAVLPPQLINIYLTRSDLQKLMDSCFFTLTCLTYTVKLTVFFLHRKKIENFFKRLRYPIFSPKRKEHLKVLKNCTFIAKISTLFFLILPQMTCISWIMIPLVENNQKKELLFAAWYPFDTTRNSAFIITYAFQAIFLLNTATMNGMLDVLITNFYVLMVGQTEILKQDCKLLADSSRLLLKDDFCYAEDNIKKILHERIINCTRHYKAIITSSNVLYIFFTTPVLNFVEDVKNLFQIGIVTQVCASCSIICVTCFTMSLISPSTFQFYVMLQYQMCMLMEIFVYTWQGNEITLKTSELNNAIYECAWTAIPDKKFRQSLCILMSGLQMPMKIRVGNFFMLSVDTFFSILRSAYSFYVLLKQFQAKRE